MSGKYVSFSGHYDLTNNESGLPSDRSVVTKTCLNFDL